MVLGRNILIDEVKKFLNDYNYIMTDNEDGFRVDFKDYNDYYMQFSCDEQIGWNVFIVPISLDFDLTGEYENIYIELELIVDKINNEYYYYDKKTISNIVENLTILKNFIYENLSKFNVSSVIDKDFILAIDLKDLYKSNAQLIEVGYSRSYSNWFFHHNNVDFLNNKNFEFIKSLRDYITMFNKN